MYALFMSSTSANVREEPRSASSISFRPVPLPGAPPRTLSPTRIHRAR